MELSHLEKALGVSFKDRAILQLALVQSSYANENPAAAPVPNERLEFLGDAVLGLIVADRLYRDLPALPEGDLTQRRAVLIRRETLVRLARRIHLGDYLYLGRGEEASGGRDKPANLSGALEAVIGAIYLDRGFAAARRAVTRLLGEELKGISRRDMVGDDKSRLQEIVQARYQVTPVYHTVGASGPDHDPSFTIEVLVNGRVMGRGVGKSKKIAEAEAAHAALHQLQPDFTE